MGKWYQEEGQPYDQTDEVEAFARQNMFSTINSAGVSNAVDPNEAARAGYGNLGKTALNVTDAQGNMEISYKYGLHGLPQFKTNISKGVIPEYNRGVQESKEKK